MRCSPHFSFARSLQSIVPSSCLMSFTKRSQSAKLPSSSGLRQCGHSDLPSSIQVRRQCWQASLLQEGHMRGFFTVCRQM